MKNNIIISIIFILIRFDQCFSQVNKIKIDTIKGSFLLDFGQNSMVFKTQYEPNDLCSNIETYNKNNIIIFNKDINYSNNYVYGIFHFVPDNDNINYIGVITTTMKYLWKNNKLYKKYEEVFDKNILKKLKKTTFIFDDKKNKLVSHNKRFGYYFLSCKIICIKDNEINYFTFPNFVDGIYKDVYSYENYFILDIIF
ncbi:MAG: hypothetical protein EAZ44_05980 [Cytophagia bacterium]|nr:MAG: hypothetical protein EAY69_04540 [Cytophagales bacterium]TAG03505.1 MAG: hypothetical protein EAZ44_05980 [Cytophagia bacterium]TAG42865.1 MAG: hypothetical protein EAZ31_05455 [Cytophagia bacterium]TAH29595.1 MAG: hypothetical protein EAZ06_06105 [Cytophagales bacterium]